MADSQHDFSSLMRRLEEGDNDAASELLELYGGHILRVIRRRLHSMMRAQFDSTDFYQAVWASFFKDETEIARFKTPDELIAFLGRVANNKVVNEVRRRMMSQKDNINRERSLDDTQRNIGTTLTDRADTPSQIAVANEQYELIVQGNNERDRQILSLKASGESCKSIAKKLEINERTVRRVIERVRQRL